MKEAAPTEAVGCIIQGGQEVKTEIPDLNGNLSRFTDRKSQITNYTYDALNRLSQVTFADQSTITYTWDAGNRLTQVVDSLNGIISRSYDGLDRLLSETTIA